MNSSQSRSRKRNSTLQAIDLLNSVNNNDTSLPRPRRRNLSRKPFVPRSDDVFEVPSSPEKQRRPPRRGAKSAPGTPRRSKRRISSLYDRLTRTDNKESRGIDHATNTRLSSDKHEGDDKDSDRNSDGDSEEEGELHPVPIVFGRRVSKDDKDTEQDTEEPSRDNADNALPNADEGEQATNNNANHEESNNGGMEQGTSDNISYELDPLQQAAHEDEAEDSSAEQLASDVQQEVGNAERAPTTNASTEGYELHSPNHLQQADDNKSEGSSEEESASNVQEETGNAEQVPNDNSHKEGYDLHSTNHVQQAEHDNESESSAEEKPTSNTQQEAGAAEEASIASGPTRRYNFRSPISTRKRKLEEVSGTEEVQQEPEPEPQQSANGDSGDESGEEASEESDNEAKEESESEEGTSSDSEEEPGADSGARPQKRPRTNSPELEQVSVEIHNPRRKSPILGESDNQSARSSRQARGSHSPSSSSSEDESDHAAPTRESREPSAIAESVAEAEQDDAEPQSGESTGEAPWMEQAQNLGQQKENWDAFMKHSNALQRKADPSMVERFSGPNNLIIKLHQTYVKMRKELARGSTISFQEVAGCENLLRGISNEGFSILDEVWSLSNKGREELARILLKGFETHVLPAMAGLVISCFLAYYVGEARFPRSYAQLHGAMALLQLFCNRISNQVKTGVVQSKMLNRKLNIALKKLIKALESGAMNLGVEIPSRIRRRSGPFSYEDDFIEDHPSDVDGPVAEKEWSDEEGKTLVQALQLYKGTPSTHAPPNREIKLIILYRPRPLHPNNRTLRLAAPHPIDQRTPI